MFRSACNGGFTIFGDKDFKVKDDLLTSNFIKINWHLPKDNNQLLYLFITVYTEFKCYHLTHILPQQVPLN